MISSSAYKYVVIAILLFTSCRGVYTRYSSGQLVHLDSNQRASIALIDSMIKPYRDSMSDLVDDTIGYLDHAMAVAKPESELGNLLADYLLAYIHSHEIRHKHGWDNETEIDFAVFNKGGFRIPLPGGPITVSHIMQLMPFDNTLVFVELDGTQMNQLAQTICEKGGDPMAPQGAKIICHNDSTQISLGDGGQKIYASGTYIVLTSNYLADGGDGYSIFKSAKTKFDTGILIRDALKESFQANTTEAVPGNSWIEGRIEFEP